MEVVDDHVSCQVLETIFIVAEEKNVDADWLLENVPFDRAHFRKRTNYIDWSSFANIANRLASQLSEQEIFELSEASYHYPIYKVWLLIGRFRFDLFGFYTYIMGEGGIAAQFYPIEIETLYSAPALGRLSLRYSIPEHLEPCEPIFRVFEGQAVGMSRALGYAPSEVKASYGARHLELDIFLPPETGLIPRLRRAITFPFTWRENYKVLQETQDALLVLQGEMLEESRQLKKERELSGLVQNQLELVLRHQRVMLWTVDLELQSTYMSESVKTFIGYTVEEMNSLPPFSTLSKESMELAVTTFQEFFAREMAGEPFYGTNSLRFLQIRKDGSTFWSENYLSFLRNEGGEPIGIMGFSVDITEVIEREAREESLEQQVQNLRQREFVSQIAGGIAHDFNNSLQSIIGFADLALADIEDKNLPVELADLQRHILNSAASATELTKKLLALSRQQSLNRKPVNLSAWLRECLPIARSVLGKGIELKIESMNALPVRIDALEMERALLNLLINARDAMGEEGCITISSQVRDAATLELELPTINSQSPAQYVELTVQDTGAGIPDADLARIFEPFFSSKTSDMGTGLGLAITAGIVEQHGGFIRASNLPAGGAVLHIYLPRDDGVAEQSHSGDESLSFAGLRILLVDDEDLVRELCGTFLEAAGAIVTEAVSGKQAVELIQASEFDLLVMDVMMPEMTGNEAARIIRQTRPEQKILFITGFAGSKDVLAELAEDAVLPKPFRRNEFLRAVSEVLADQIGG
jgi:PAS domain S-box-containing protein